MHDLLNGSTGSQIADHKSNYFQLRSFLKQLKVFVAGQRVQHIEKQPIGGMTMSTMPSKKIDVYERMEEMQL